MTTLTLYTSTMTTMATIKNSIDEPNNLKGSGEITCDFELLGVRAGLLVFRENPESRTRSIETLEEQKLLPPQLTPIVPRCCRARDVTKAQMAMG